MCWGYEDSDIVGSLEFVCFGGVGALGETAVVAPSRIGITVEHEDFDVMLNKHTVNESLGSFPEIGM